jgi:hypothetical protein
MKTDKEYPATHSMATSWYIADENGNVGIMNYEDNGPVPLGTSVERSMNELLLGLNGNESFINLTDEQILDVVGRPFLESEIYWPYCTIRINPNRTEEFLVLCKKAKHFIDRCISERLGLYSLDTSDCVDIKENAVIKGSILDEVIKDGMIDAVYQAIEAIDVYSECSDERISSLPYYIYMQSLDTNELPERLCKPLHPVTLSQISEILRNRIPRLPIKFDEVERFQIAQLVPCKYYFEND